MSDPLTDYRRSTGQTTHPGQVDETVELRTVARGVRTALAFLLGAVAAVALGAALVLAVGVVHVLSPERPARVLPVVLAAPEVRLAAAQDMASDLESDRDVPFTDAERTALVDAIDQVLGSPELHRQLGELRPVDGRIDWTELAATFESELRAQAAGRPAEVQQVLRETAAEVPRLVEEEGSSADASGMVASLTEVRRWVLIAAGVVAAPGLVVGAIALAVARRRPLTAVLVSSGALLLAVLALAPGRFVLERLPGPLSIPGHVLAAIGELSGPGTMWALVLAIVVPPGGWWAARSLRSSRRIGMEASGTPTAHYHLEERDGQQLPAVGDRHRQ